jgi:hypothetical protein
MLRLVISRLLVPAAAVLTVLSLSPVEAAARVIGSCDAIGFPVASGASAAAPLASAASATQLGTATRWVVPTSGGAAAQAASSAPTHRLDAQARFFGIGFPVAHWRGVAVSGIGGPWQVGGPAVISRVAGLTAQSDGCSGSVVMVADESPFVTVLGWLGLLAAIVGGALVGLLAWRRRSRGGPARIGRPRVLLLGGGAGLCSGLGAGIFLQETEVLSPLDWTSLLIPAAGMLAGVVAVTIAAERPLLACLPVRSQERLRAISPPALLPGPLPKLPTAAVAGALIGLIVAALPAGIGPGSRGSAVAVTPARAADIVRIYWDANNRALATADPNLRAPYETGVLGQATRHHLQGLKSLGVTLKPEPLQSLHIYVPRQESFPAVFAASFDTDQQVDTNQVQHQTWYVLFTRQDAHSPWLAATLAISPTGNHVPRFAVGSDGYTTPWDPGSTRLSLAPGQVSSAYATYIDQGLASGQASGPFSPGPLTTERVTGLRTALRTTATQLGVATSLDFQQAPLEVAFAGQDKTAIVFVSVADHFTITAKPPRCLVQGDGRFDPLLADGKYREVREASTDQFLVIDGARDVDVIGSSIQTQDVSGDLGTGCA